jgi:tetratricopeptide (TPR) repeat protein
MLSLAIVFLLATQPAGAPPGPARSVAELNAESSSLTESEPQRALELAQSAVALARKTADVAGEALALNNVAVAYRSLSVPDLAAASAQLSAERAAAASDQLGEARAYNTLGLVVADIGRAADALGHHLRALAIRERVGDKAGISYSLNNLGNIYRGTQNYDKALEYHARSLALKIELGDRRSEAYSHHNIGMVFSDMGEMQRALAAFRRGLEIREAIGDQWGMASSLNAIAVVQARTSPTAALATYERTLVLRRTVGDKRGEANTYKNIGNLRLRMGDTPRAMAALERSLTLATEARAPLTRIETLQHLSETEAARGNYPAALERYREHAALKDSLFNQQSSDRINRLQAAHESERREQRTALLESARELAAASRQHVLLVRSGLLVVLVLTGLCLALVYARYRSTQQSARLQA